VTPHLKVAIPPLMVAVKEKNVPVKLASERALLYCLELKKGVQVMEVCCPHFFLLLFSPD